MGFGWCTELEVCILLLCLPRNYVGLMDEWIWWMDSVDGFSPELKVSKF